jgi:cell division protein FtsB
MVQAQAAQIAVLVAENEALKKRVVELEERRCCTDRLRLPARGVFDTVHQFKPAQHPL